MRTALLLALLALQASPRVTMTVSSESVAPGEPFELRIVVETDGAQPEIRLGVLPAGFELIQNMSGSQFRTNFPGGSSRVTTNTYTLVGRVPGSFVLPSATIRIGGREYPGRALSVTVRRPGAGAELRDPTTRPRLTVTAEPRRAWVGQPVLLRAEAMFPRELRGRLTRPATYEPPSATGFWVIDLPNPMTLQLQRVGNEVWEVQTHRRVYVPIVPGTHTLAPARLSYEIRSGLLQPPESRYVLSDTLSLEVLELPSEGRPAAFAGAVGSFTMVADVEPTAVAAGEAASIRVEIRGRGNVRALSAPEIHVPPSIELLPPAETVNEDLTGADIVGSKVFRWALIPKEPGRIALAPIEFSFFEPGSRAFRVLRTDSLVLDVAGFSGSEEAQGLSPPDRSPAPPGLGFVRTPAFAVAQAIPLLLILAVWWRGRRASGPRPPAPGPGRTSHRADVARLRAAARRGEPGVADELAALLRLALAERGGTARAASGADAMAAAIEAIAAEVDEVRFSPGDSSRRLINLVERAGKALDSHGAATREAHGSGGLMLAVLAALPASLFGLGQAGPFERGVEALGSGDLVGARTAFEAYLATQPRDANAWHNLGNAAYRMGDRATATHAWLQALAYDPRHEGARHNVIAVAGAEAAGVLKPRIAPNGELALLALAAVWWLAVLAAVAAPRAHRATVVGGAAILALAIAVAWLAGRNAPDLATTRVDGVPILAEPALQSDAVRRLVAGEPLVVIDASGDWIRVRSTAGVVGWVEASRLRFVSSGFARVLPGSDG